jgi:hypothetical protein
MNLFWFLHLVNPPGLAFCFSGIAIRFVRRSAIDTNHLLGGKCPGSTRRGTLARYCWAGMQPFALGFARRLGLQFHSGTVFADRGYHQNNRTVERLASEDSLAILVPTKKPKGGELSEQQKQSNRTLSAIRAVVEHPFRVIKAAIRFHQGSLSRTQEEHRANRDLVCAGQPVAGTQAIVAPRGRGAPVMRDRWGKYPDSCGQRSKFACFSSFL